MGQISTQLTALNHLRCKAIHSFVPHMPINIIKRHIFNKYRIILQPKIPTKTHLHRTRLASFTIPEMQEIVSNAVSHKKNNFLWNNIKVSLKRIIILYEIGFQCKHCNIQGTMFHLEKELTGNGYHLDLYSDDDTMMTIDHITPRSKGGPDNNKNKQCLCKVCNETKSNKFIG